MRRGATSMDLKEQQDATVHRFKEGDLVTPYYAPANDFYGVVVNVNPIEEKVYVDFNGTIRQMDPNEIRIVLKYQLQELEGERRGNKIASTMRDVILDNIKKGEK